MARLPYSGALGATHTFVPTNLSRSEVELTHVVMILGQLLQLPSALMLDCSNVHRTEVSLFLII